MIKRTGNDAWGTIAQHGSHESGVLGILPVPPNARPKRPSI